MREWGLVGEAERTRIVIVSPHLDDAVLAFIYSRKPKASVLAGMTRTRDNLETHARTWPS